MGKKSLGRGMSAIFKDHSIPDVVEGVALNEMTIQSISLDEIDPNPYQPRRVFSDDEIQELSETIKEHGLIQPITVRRHQGRFQIISGERRVRASRHAGLTQIDARVFNQLSNKSMMEWAIIENVQRVDLNPIEISQSYELLISNHGYTHDDLAKRLGKSRSAITNSLRLLRLPESVQMMVEKGELSASHARSLLSPDITDIETAAQKIMKNGMSVRATEKLTHKKSSAIKNERSPLNPNIVAVIQELEYALGTKVSFQSKSKQRGMLQIEFENFDDLERIRKTILNTQPESIH